MPNLTLAIDDDLLARARRRAAEKGTTVNAVVRDSLRRFTEDDVALFDQQAEARAGLLDLIRTSEARMSPSFRWNREDANDRAALRGHQRPGLRGDRSDHGAEEADQG